jgi:hypothetical protein
MTIYLSLTRKVWGFLTTMSYMCMDFMYAKYLGREMRSLQQSLLWYWRRLSSPSQKRVHPASRSFWSKMHQHLALHPGRVVFIHGHCQRILNQLCDSVVEYPHSPHLKQRLKYNISAHHVAFPSHDRFRHNNNYMMHGHNKW